MRALLLVLAVFGLFGCGPKPPGQCSSWGCHETASAPLAWTRAGGDSRGMDILSTGDLCVRHAAKAPFALATRFMVVCGLFPAMLLGWVSFRILYLVDQHGPGLATLMGTRRKARIALFSSPFLLSGGWLLFFVLRSL